MVPAGPWTRLRRFVLDPTPHISPGDDRTSATFNIGALAAFLIHLCVLPIFWVLGATELLWLNLLRESAYLAALWSNRRGRPETMT